MHRILLFLLFTFCLGNFSADSQTTINRGDLAIVAVNANLPAPNATRDEISFVCFKDITTGTQIQVTDNGYESCVAGLWSGGEGGAILTRTGGTIPKGTVITLRTDPFLFLFPDASWTASNLSATQLTSNLNMNAGGDQIYFAQGGTWANQVSNCTINGTRTDPNAIYPGNAGRILFGFSTSGGWSSFQQSSGESGLYPGMTCFSMAPTSNPYSKYSGPLTAATQTDWIARISNTSNWSSYTQANYATSGNNYAAGLTISILSGGDIPTATWTVPSALCANAAAIDLNTYVTGTTGGTWSGTGVTGNMFNPTVLSGTYNITYSVNYVSGGNSCPITQTNTIMVNAASTAPTVTANINYCQNATATALTATGSNLLWYTVATGGSGNATTPTPLTTTVGTTNYYVSQNISCEGPRAMIAVTVSAAPTINTVTNQTVCKNSNTTAINFSGTGTAMYNWTNNTASIGLAASGSGNIASFQALNTGTTPVTATITVTPVSTGLAYVANYGISPATVQGNTVSIINTTTNIVAGTVTVGNCPFGVSVSPDGTKVYVSNYASNSVSVISTATNTVTATITVGNQPMGIAVTPDGTKVYVVNQNLLGNPGNVSVIDAATNTVIATVPVYLRPLAITISPDGTKAYVASVNSDNISVINTATNTLATVVAVGVQPTAVAINPDGSRLYVANYANNNVSIINTSTNTVIATTAVGTAPNGAAVSPDGSKVYITNQQSNNVSVINTSTNAVTATIATGSQPHGVSFTSDGSKAYVANFNSNNVSVINTSTNAVTNTVSVGTGPQTFPHSLGNFITPSSGCSGAPITFTITVGVPPSASFSYPGNPFCATGTASPIVVGTLGGTFTANGSGLVIDAVTGVINLATSTAGNYMIKYNITVDGCNTTVTTNVTVVALPTVPVVSITQPTCTAQGTLTVTSPLGTAYTYSIDGGINFQASATFNNISPGTGYVIVKDVTTGCTNTSIAITVNAPGSSPASPVTTTVQPTCTTPTGSITVTSPIGVGLTYSIDGTNFQAGTTFTGLAPNTYTVTVKNAGGCTNSSNTVTINSAASFPAPTSTIIQPTCTVPTGAITITSPIGAYTYSVDGTTFQSSTTFSNLAPATYTITVKDASGCSNAGTANITAASTLPVPTYTAIQPTCTVATGSITVLSPIGNTFLYSIDGTTFQFSDQFTNLVPATYTITVKNGAGCTNINIATINAASPVATPIPTTVQPTCTVSTGSITIISPTGAGLTYSIDGTTFQSSTTFSNLVPNSYTITVKNASGCTNTNTTHITAASTLPVPTYTAIQPTCTVQTGSITVLSPISNSILYSIDGSTFQFSNIFTNLAPATYTVTARNGAGCTNSVIVTINAPGAAPTAPTVTTPVSYCQNTIATALTANGNNLLWYTSNTGGTGNSTAPIPSTATVGTTNYYVSQTMNGCESIRAMITVDIIAAPATPTIFANGPTSFCESGSVTLTSSTANNIQWYRDGVLLNGSTNVNYTTALFGIYTVSTSNANNCTATSIGTTVTVNPNPIVYAGLDLFVNEGDSAKFLATASQGNMFTYLWTPPTYLTDATLLQPWVKPATDMYYTLTVINENNCTGTSQVLVKVLKEIVIPNAFSPNGDNVNDKWNITGLDSYSYSKVEVFARSGQLVYGSVGYNKPWDGNYNGKPLPVGVYYYIINLKNGKPAKSGSVTLLR